MHAYDIPNNLPPIEEKRICEPCTQSKLHSKRTRKKREGNKSSEPLQLIFIDLIGPFPQSIHYKNTRALTLKDDYSGFVMFGFLPDKEASTVVEKLLHMLDVIYIISGVKVNTIQADYGSEFTATVFRKTLTSLGYMIRYTPTDTAAFNGQIERMHRYIVSLARAARLAASLPESFWEECMRQAVSVYNAIGTKSNPCPLKRLTGKQPTYTHFRTIGSKVLYRIPSDKIPKLQPRTRRGILIAQPTDSTPDTYRIYNPDTKRIIRSRDVVIIETEFYKWNNDQITNDTDTFESPPLHMVETVSSSDSSDDENELARKKQRTPTTHSNLSQQGRSIGAQEQNQWLNEHEARQANRGSRLSRELEGLRINNNSSWNRINRAHAIIDIPEPFTGDNTPSTFKKIKGHAQEIEWNKAVQQELCGLIKMNAFHLTKDKPKDRTLLNPRWVFTTKLDENGNVDRYKARLTIAAWNTIKGIDYQESYAPVASRNTIRLCLALAAYKGLKMRQFDTPLAYLNGTLDTPAYMRLPAGLDLVQNSLPEHCRSLYNTGGDYVICKVTKPLYGLPQSGKCWYDELKSKLNNIGFQPSNADPAMFLRHTRNHGLTILLAYVDDLCCFASDDSELNSIEATMFKHWKTKSFGTPSWYLKMKINCQPGRISLSQSLYVSKLLEKFNMTQANQSPVPCVPTDFVPTDTDQPLTDEPYRELVGSLLYIANGTRPDISYAVGLCARYSSQPLQRHWRALKRILRYLKGTANYGLIYSANNWNLQTYADSSYADDTSDRKSTSGRTILIDGGPISWTSEKQKCVATSTAEAEYMSLGAAAKDVIWTRNILSELNELAEGPSLIYQDNQASISMATNVRVSSKSKHIQVRHHFVRELIEDGSIVLEYMPTQEMIADIFTKPLGRVLFQKLRDLIVQPTDTV